MTTQINFSVVIPCFNREDTIKRAINSVLNQRIYSPLEIIVLDDFSTDDTIKEVESLREILSNKNIDLIIKSSPENLGPSKQRNCGIDLARGDYIGFLDSDDSWNENKLQVFMSDLGNNPSIVFWTNEYSIGNKNGSNNIASQKIRKINFFEQLLKNHASCPCVIIRKTECLKFREDMRYCEDYEFFTRMSYFFPLYKNYLPLTTIYRPINSMGGLSGNIWKMRLGEMRMYIYATNYCPYVLIILLPLIVFSGVKHLRMLWKSL